MDEKYLQGLYDHLGGDAKFGAFNDFKDAMGTDAEYRQQFYQGFGGQERFGAYTDFDGLVKKKDGGKDSLSPGISSPSDVTGDTAVGGTPISASGASALTDPGAFAAFINPSALLNRRQRTDFARQGGYVMSPEKATTLANEIKEKPASQQAHIRDRLIDIVDESFKPVVESAGYMAQQAIELGGDLYGAPAQQQAQVTAFTKKALQSQGYSDAVSFVDDAITTQNVAPLRDVVNNYYGSQMTAATKKALGIRPKEQTVTSSPLERNVGSENEQAFYDTGLTTPDEEQRLKVLSAKGENKEKVQTTLAPIMQEKEKVNLLLDQVVASKYAINNPGIQENYDQDVAGTKPLKNEISANQYSGLQYFKDNYPELYNTYQLELSKAADPALFGTSAVKSFLGVHPFASGDNSSPRPTYDKSNRDYQYMMYVLDKKGVELNAMSAQQQLESLAPAKQASDLKYKTQLNALTTQLRTATSVDQADALRGQIDQVNSQYAADPAQLQYNQVQSAAVDWDVDFNAKYPDYASRAREQKVREILSGDGKSIFGEVMDRVKWLASDTYQAVEHLAGIKEAEIGSSRAQIRAMRLSEQQQGQQYQPQFSAATQPLYKLNFNNADYQAISDIKESEMSEKEKGDAIETYLNQNRDRIQYVDNPDAGKRNWTPAAIGNQVADVTTQVLFQAALTYATDGALRGRVPPAAVAAQAERTAATAEATDAAIAAVAPQAAAAAQGMGSLDLMEAYASTGGQVGAVPGMLKDKLYHYGSVVGTTYAVVYQQAYVSALSDGKSQDEAESYANQIALVNGLSEVINPDVDVVKKAAQGVEGLAGAVTRENLTRGALMRQAGRSFAKGYISNVVPETLEEVAAAYGEYGVDALHNMNQDEMNNLNNRVEQAVTATLVGMAPFGAWSGMKTTRNTSALMREQYYRAGLYADNMRGEINSLQQSGAISADDANRRVQLVGTMQNIVRNIPRPGGQPMSDDAAHHYAFNKLQQTYLTAEMDQTDNQDSKDLLAVRIGELQEKNMAILKGQLALSDQVMEAPQQNPGTGVTAQGATGATVAPAPAAYNAGDEIKTADGGAVQVVGSENGRYSVSFPDGSIDDFTEKEIDELLKPVEVVRAGQTPQDRADESAGASAQDEQRAGVTVVPPDGRTATQIITPATAIVSPTNTTQNATDQIDQQESVLPERENGDRSGQTPEASGSNRLRTEAEGSQEGQIAPSVEAPTPAVSVEQGAGQQPAPQAVGAPLQEPAPVAVPVQEQGAAGPGATLPAEQGPQKTRKQRAIEGVQSASRIYRQAAARVVAAQPGTPEWTEASQASKAAAQGLHQAENEHLAALSAENTLLSRKKRAKLFSGVVPTGDDARIIGNYIDMARIYVRRGVRTLEGFAKNVGEHVNDYMRRAWDITHGTTAPVKEKGETNKAFLERLRAYERTEVPELTVGEDDQEGGLRQQVEQSRTGLSGLSQGIDMIRRDINTSREDFNQQLGLPATDYTTYVAALKWNRENNPIKRRSATRVLNNLRENNPKKVIAAEMKVASLQIKALERAARLRVQQATKISFQEGKQVATALAAERAALVRESLKDIFDQVQQSGALADAPLSSADALAIGRLIANVSTSAQLDKVTGLFNRLIDDAHAYATQQSIAKLQKKLRAVTGADSVVTANLRAKQQPLSNRGLLRSLAAIDASKISNPAQLLRMLDNIVGAVTAKVETTPETATSEAKKSIVKLQYTANQIADFITAANQEVTAQAAASASANLTDATGFVQDNFPDMDAAAVMNTAGISAIIDSTVANAELTEQQKQQQLNTMDNAIDSYVSQIEEGAHPQDISIEDIYEGLSKGNPKQLSKKSYDTLVASITEDQAAMQKMADAPGFADQVPLPADQQLFKDIAQVNTDGFSGKELNELKNIIENILLNNNYSGAEYYQRAYFSQREMTEFNEWAARQTVKLDVTAFDSLLGKIAKTISTKDMIVHIIANNFPEFAAKLNKATSLGDIKAANTGAQIQLGRDVIDPLRSLRSKYQKADVNSAPSTMRRGMYAYLVQSKEGSNPTQMQAEFERRKTLLQQDYARKQSSDDKLDRTEGELEEQLYNDHFAGIETISALLGSKEAILNEGERAIYDMFTKYYADNVDQYAAMSERLLNTPFQRWNHYTKDSFKRLSSGLSQTGYTSLGAPMFATTPDVNDPASSMIERGNYKDLDQIAARNEDGGVEYYRVLNFDFDSQQLNNSRDMTADLYSLPARVQAAFTLRSPTLKDVVGADNARLLKDNINDQVRSNLKRHISTQDGPAERGVYRLAEISNKIAARLALFSISQIFKQPGDIFSNTVANMAGRNMTDIFKAWKLYPIALNKNEDVVRLMDQSEIGLRGKSHAVTSWLVPPAVDQIKNSIKEFGKQADLKRPDRLSHLIEGPDTWAAKTAWLAYYGQSLKSQGLVKNFSDIDWKEQADNINREARDYADSITATRLNIHAKESASAFYEKSSKGWGIVASLFLPFSSFSMNNWALMYGDFKTLYGDGTFTQNLKDWKVGKALTGDKSIFQDERKQRALKSIASRVVAEYAFQTIRALSSLAISKVASTALYSLTGIPPREQDNKDFLWKLHSEVVRNMAFSMLGNISSDFATNIINSLSNKTVGTDVLYSYKTNPNRPPGNLGTWSIGNNSFDKVKYYREILGSDDEKGGQVEVPTAERLILAADWIAQAGSWYGAAPAEARQVLDRMSEHIHSQYNYKEEHLIRVGGANQTPRIKIKGRDIEAWTPDQLQYYNAQHAYHLKQLEKMKWTDEHKAREATARTKRDFEREFKGQIKLKPKE